MLQSLSSAARRASTTSTVTSVRRQVCLHRAALQSKLRKYGKGRSDAEDWAKIADFGMTGFMGGYEIPMLEAITTLKNSNGSAAEKADVKQKATEFFQYIKSSDLINWLDNTPSEIGFQTTIQADLGGALSALIKKI